MIKVYSMNSCSECKFVKEQIKDDARFEVIEIGESIFKLKEFLKIRDSHPLFEAVKQRGAAGVPCFVLEDGTVTLKAEDAGLVSMGSQASACSIDGKGNC